MKPWFAYDPENGIEFFETKQQARNYAEDALSEYRDLAHEGWPEEVTEICWGRVCQGVEVILDKPDDSRSPDFDRIVDYDLRSPEEIEAT